MAPWVRLLGGLGVALAAVGCGGRVETTSADDPTPGTVREAVGPAANARNAGTRFPQVGRLFGSTGNCTATVIAPNVVLTAAHCICGNTTGSLSFVLDDFTVSPPGQATGPRFAVATADYGPAWCTSGTGDTCPLGTLRATLCPTVGNPTLGQNAADIAVLTLTANVPSSAILNADPQPVATDWRTGFAFPRNQGGFFVGYGGTVFGTNTNAGTKRFVSVPAGLFGGSQGAITTSVNRSVVFTARGDSGGPYLVPGDGSPTVQVGVSSAFYSSTDASCPSGPFGAIGALLNLCGGGTTLTVAHAPTYDDSQYIAPPRPGLGTGRWTGRNGEFVRRFVEDDDHDSIIDQFDNCPNDANFDQADADGDGVGDVCDNCGANAPRGVPSSKLPNPRPPCTTDADCAALGAGACLATTTRHCSGQADADQDGFGDSCDTCPGAQGAFDLDSSDRDGVAAACDNCPDDSVIPNADQRDTDGDGIGDVCDTCPANPDPVGFGLRSNANADAEVAEGAPPLADDCDPVPTFSTQQAAVPRSGGGQDVVVFDVTRGFAPAVNQTNPQPAQVTENTQFRYCSCIAADGSVLDRDTCVRTQCRVSRNSQDLPPWLRITTRYANGQPTLDSVPVQYQAGVNVGIPCEGGNSLCALGRFDSKGLVWNFRDDVNAGRIPTTGSGNAQTAPGILWSRTDFTTVTSDRDQQFLGRLRSTYTGVQGPFVGPEPPTLVSPIVTCEGACFTFPVDPLFDPDPVLVSPVNWAQLLDNRPLVIGRSGSVIGLIRGTDRPILDVTAAFTPSVTNLVLRTDLKWAHAVEPMLSRRPSVLAVAIPKEFNVGSGVFVVGKLPGGGFISGEGSTPAAILGADARASASGIVFSPSAQQNATIVYSASQNSIFMMGGQNSSGAPTRELWRGDLGRDAWEPLATAVRPDGTVLAATFLPATQTLLTISQVKSVGVGSEIDGFALPNLLPAPPTTLRLTAIDIAHKQGFIVGEWPRVGLFDRFSLAISRDNHFVLAGSSTILNAWTAVRFDLVGDDRHPVAVGIAGGLSTIQADLVSARDGIWVPVNALGGGLNLVRLQPSDFIPLGIRHAPWEDQW